MFFGSDMKMSAVFICKKLYNQFMSEDLFFDNQIDLVLLDIMLPGMSGFEICRELRKNSTVPIIFITAKGLEEDILYGYSCGCDDYIVKPFSFNQLNAKMMALLKRSKGMIIEDRLVCGDIVLDPVHLTVFAKGEMVELAPKEFALLKHLMENKNIVLSRDTLLTKIWGYDYGGSDRVVDNHIKKLRKALLSSGAQIKTKFKNGYSMEEN